MEKEEPNTYIPPDGGFKAWLCVAGSFLLQFASFGYVNACGIFQFYYAEEMLSYKSSSSLAWITTLQIFLLFFFGPVVGMLIDAIGPRPILIPFSTLCVFAIFMLSLCKNYWQVMLAQGVAFGFGTSGVSMPAMVLVSQWFSTKKGLAVGIVSAGSSFGGIIFPIMVPRLIARHGFPAAVRWTGLLVGICLLLANLACSSPFPPKGFQKKESAGLKGFKSLPWAAFTLGCFFVIWGLFAPLNYLPLMAAQKGMSMALAQYTISITNAGSFFGRILPGWMSDRIGQFNMMFVVSILSGASLIAFWLPLELHPSNAGIIVFAAFYGFVSGGFVSLGPPCVVSLAEGRVEEIGVKLGGFCLAIALGSLTGLPIEGAIKDREGDKFIGLMIFAGVVMCLGGFLVGVARVLKGGFRLTAKV
ncbi:putative MFS transporter [Xylona heveae TC161]|uniref:Putative MFS transporter n=1 Tax=Xylona heveae (strain CBS 132557 / TC161) TaxID=1328760 RepID=A0A165IQ83_XYLHT|nr:putative MFS transporter [Xylona heveae TC161]KZF25224.1 putative MFS transporter [Xylona heveae TC161]